MNILHLQLQVMQKCQVLTQFFPVCTICVLQCTESQVIWHLLKQSFVFQLSQQKFSVILQNQILLQLTQLKMATVQIT